MTYQLKPVKGSKSWLLGPKAQKSFYFKNPWPYGGGNMVFIVVNELQGRFPIAVQFNRDPPIKLFPNSAPKRFTSKALMSTITFRNTSVTVSIPVSLHYQVYPTRIRGKAAKLMWEHLRKQRHMSAGPEGRQIAWKKPKFGPMEEHPYPQAQAEMTARERDADYKPSPWWAPENYYNPGYEQNFNRAYHSYRLQAAQGSARGY